MSVLTEDFHLNDVLRFPEAVFSHQLVAAFVLSDGFCNGDLRAQGRPVHLKKIKMLRGCMGSTLLQ